VGSGGVAELNGTFDMMGNVFEWMESPYVSDEYWTGFPRELRGGAFHNHVNLLASSWRGGTYPYNEAYDIGFRVASVPEPSSLALLSLGGLALLRRRR
jgi:formylglycine-generating enzyme required for sulfatase activity